MSATILERCPINLHRTQRRQSSWRIPADTDDGEQAQAEGVVGTGQERVRLRPYRHGAPRLAVRRAAFAAERQAVAALLGFEDGESVVVGGYSAGRDLCAVFARLLALEDDEVTRILTFVMAETLEAHSAITEQLGALLGTDPMTTWPPDDTFFDLLRDKQVINAMLGELAGDTVAKANLTATECLRRTAGPSGAKRSRELHLFL